MVLFYSICHLNSILLYHDHHDPASFRETNKGGVEIMPVKSAMLQLRTRGACGGQRQNNRAVGSRRRLQPELRGEAERQQAEPVGADHQGLQVASRL